MLGARTKQVFTYGRRGQRVVNVSDDVQRNKSLPAASSRKLENVARSKTPVIASPSFTSTGSSASESDSDFSPPLSIRKPLKKNAVSTAKRMSNAVKNPPNRPVRRPLSTYSSNVPRSPATTRKKMKPTSGVGKGLPLTSSSPVVKVDILVLDDQGHAISRERRASRPAVQVNSAGSSPSTSAKPQGPTKESARRPLKKKIDLVPKVAKKPVPSTQVLTRAEPILISDSEEDNPLAPFSSIDKKTHRPIVLSSDSSDSEDEPNILNVSAESSPEVLKPRKRQGAKKVVLSSPDSDLSDNSMISPAFPKQNESHLRHPKEPTKNIAPIPRPVFSPVRPNRYHLQRQHRLPSISPAPPSPILSDSDLDLSLDLEGLALSPSTRKQIAASFRALETSAPAYLQPLLAECSQTTPHEFSAFIEMFPRDPIVHISHDCTGFDKPSESLPTFQKIGEASYSEVFGIGNVVLKIIPLRDEERKHSPNNAADIDTPSPSDAKDVLKEIVVTKAMGDICEGFVKLLRTYVVRGKYPSLLLELWDEFNERKGSESVRPDSFTPSQTYTIIVLPNGGPDLEAYTFNSASKTVWRQACSIFWQVTRALVEAEDLVHFEHRDLHWGQILVKNTDYVQSPRMRGKRLPMDDDAHGVRATIIDLGLARMDDGDGTNVRWTPFEDEIFEGDGDYQFDVYRMMRVHNGNSWEEYRPLTNVMWLHYLILKLLKSKRLRPPTVSRRTQAIGSSAFSEQECYACLTEMDGILARAIEGCKVQPVAKKGRRKAQTSSLAPSWPTGPQSAAQVVQLGIERGWLS